MGLGSIALTMVAAAALSATAGEDSQRRPSVLLVPLDVLGTEPQAVAEVTEQMTDAVATVACGPSPSPPAKRTCDDACWREAAADAGCDYLLRGVLRVRAATLEISLRLIATRDGTVVDTTANSAPKHLGSAVLEVSRLVETLLSSLTPPASPSADATEAPPERADAVVSSEGVPPGDSGVDPAIDTVATPLSSDPTAPLPALLRGATETASPRSARESRDASRATRGVPGRASACEGGDERACAALYAACDRGADEACAKLARANRMLPHGAGGRTAGGILTAIGGIIFLGSLTGDAKEAGIILGLVPAGVGLISLIAGSMMGSPARWLQRHRDLRRQSLSSMPPPARPWALGYSCDF